jgi:hypothetical protein
LYNNLITNNEFTSKGRCLVTDTTIQFLCDTSKIQYKGLMGDQLKKLSNIPFILKGEILGRQDAFILPYNIYYETEDSIIIPKGTFARYYTGDGYGSNIIELKRDNTYIFYDHSCVANFTETGTWSLEKGVVNFVPKEKKWSMLEWITQERKLYLTEDYLIGKKTKKTSSKTNKILVTETYAYLSKEPLW